jgi:multidrug efflux pump subunit AcrB
MNLTALALKNKTFTLFALSLLAVGGVFSFFQLGQLEDPDFSIKRAVVITLYPGASPEEVELEVTDRLETALQELTQLDHIYSMSRAGASILVVDIQEKYWADALPQVWDEMRKKIRDVVPMLPPTATKPEIMDDFSFVYGFVLAVTGDGYSYADLERYVKAIKRELSLVDGVSRVELWGVQPKVVYIDSSQQQLSETGISEEAFLATLSSQNMVVDAGGFDVGRERLRAAPTGEFESPEDIGDLIVRRYLDDIKAELAEELSPALAGKRSTDLITIKDIADVSVGYLEPPITKMRFDGKPALAISAANVTGGNVVDTGANLDEALEKIRANLPVGIELEPVAWQSDLVSQSIGAFMINLIEAVVIVLVVLWLAMGWRMGVIIGTSLVLTILGTFIVMKGMAIDLQRVSLGALVVALGMMVDNAIVVADGMVVRLKKGMEPEAAAIESAHLPAMPLLGATVIAVMTFYPVYASVMGAGEYAQSLFLVVGISLMLSWVISMTLTPLQCIWMLGGGNTAGGKDENEDPYDTRMFRAFRGLVTGAIRQRWLTLGGMVVLLVAAVIGFGLVEQQFFPDSTREQFMIDYWAPEGTRTQQVAEDIEPLEARLVADPRVKNVSSFIGAGGPRFYLPVDPELPAACFANMVVNTVGLKEVNELVAELQPWVDENFPQAMVRVRKYTVGPGDTWQFELRVSGPAGADLGTLRRLGEEGAAILRDAPMAKNVRLDLRNRVKRLEPEFDQKRARWSRVGRGQVARAIRRSYDGVPVGVYRDGDDMLPIIVRHSAEERAQAAATLDLVQVPRVLSSQTVPLSEVTAETRVVWEDPIIARWDRRREVAIQAVPNGVTFPALLASVKDQFEEMESNLPPGYRFDWDGELKSTNDAQGSLVPGMVPALILILLIIIGLFGAYRPVAIIFAAVPFALIGITAGLGGTGTPFGFMALLGALSLMGMMIKNSIVLLDEINAGLAEGKSPYDSVVMAAVSRLRPVVLAAATTVLGVAPLLQDVFWTSMALTIIFGLTVGTIVTMVIVPVLYATLHGVVSPRANEGGQG